MRIISEITGQEYKTVEGCLAAEKLFEEEQARKEAEEKARAEKINAAYKKAMAAIDEYFDAVGIDFTETENGYRIHYRNSDSNIADSIWEDILNHFVN